MVPIASSRVRLFTRERRHRSTKEKSDWRRLPRRTDSVSLSRSVGGRCCAFRLSNHAFVHLLPSKGTSIRERERERGITASMAAKAFLPKIHWYAPWRNVSSVDLLTGRGNIEKEEYFRYGQTEISCQTEVWL